MHPKSLTLDLSDEKATARLGQAAADLMRPGDIMALGGDLGSGKTSFARAAIRQALGNPDEDVPSPTFTLLQTYEAKNVTWWHFDLYRIVVPEDALELGIEDAFATGISLIEWPENLGPWLPRRAMRLDLFILDPETRHAELVAPPSFLSNLVSRLAL